MDGRGEVDQPRIKRMRKGTKSCAECRRRKIKCVYEPARPDICRDCAERGSTCIEQEHAEAVPKTADSQSLKGRVAQLEDLVKRLVDKLDERNDARPGVSETPSTSSDSYAQSLSNVPGGKRLPASPPSTTASSLSQSCLNHSVHKPQGEAKRDLGTAPVIGLFDNAIVTPQGGWGEEGTTATAQDMPDSLIETDRELKLRQTLRSLFPSRKVYLHIVRTYGGWWEDSFYMSPESLAGKAEGLERSIEMALESGDSIQLALALLNLAISLEKAPSDAKFEGLELPLAPHQLGDHYVAQIYRLVLSEDEVVGTFDGVALLVMYSKFCMDVGRPRKAWLALRRAITFGQLLNLHRKSGRAVDSPSCSSVKKTYLWIDLYMLDQLVALILGQPYTIAPAHFDMDDQDFKTLPLEVSLMIREAGMAGRIVDRNMELLTKPLNTSTLQLDQDMDELERDIPEDWWHIKPRKGWRAGNHRVFIQFMHYHIRVFIHLPFMLKSATEKRFHHHRVSALQASRKMLDTYKVLRSEVFVRGNSCSKALDFQAFMAAMLLVLNLLGYSTSETSENWDDWKLVERTIELLRSTSHEIGGKVSQQCVRALELFTSCHKYSGNDCRLQGETAKVVVPFFGTLILAPGRAFDMTDYRAMAQSTLPTPQTGSEGDNTSPGSLPTQNEPFIGFDSYTNPLPMEMLGGDFLQTHNDPCLTFPDAMSHGWPMNFNMDLDHDWSWYLGNNDEGMDKVSSVVQSRNA